MLISLFFQIIISFIIIYVIHSLYLFFINNLTTPKIKDLVQKPKREYDNIYKTINKNNNDDNNDNNSNGNGNEQEDMKSELKSYLNELSNKNEDNKETFSFNNNIGYTNI